MPSRLKFLIFNCGIHAAQGLRSMGGKAGLSVSGGVESTAMCLLYGKGATAIFTDTGSEHHEMYRRIDYAEKVLRWASGQICVEQIRPLCVYAGLAAFVAY